MALSWIWTQAIRSYCQMFRLFNCLQCHFCHDLKFTVKTNIFQPDFDTLVQFKSVSWEVCLKGNKKLKVFFNDGFDFFFGGSNQN